jgi:hypothetical protein
MSQYNLGKKPHRLLAISWILLLAYSSTLKMEAIYSSGTLFDFTACTALYPGR